MIYVHNISCKTTVNVKKVRPSKVESYLEVNACTNWWQQDLISEYSQEAKHAEHINTTLDILYVAS